MNFLRKRNMAAGLMFILIIAMTLSPITSFGDEKNQANGSEDQIGDYVDVYGTEAALASQGAIKPGSESTKCALTDNGDNDLYVDYSKQIEATDTENKFKITLDVTTNDNRVKRTAPADVTLIFDVSGSMDDPMKDGNVASTKFKIYQKKMATFIESFLGSVDGNRVSIVAFGGNVNVSNDNVHIVMCDWTSSTKTAIESFNGYKSADDVRSRAVDVKKTDDNVTIGTDSKNTNAEAGFEGALDVLEADPTSNFGAVIFVSDGEANARYTDNVVGSDYIAQAQNAAVAKAGEVEKAYEQKYEKMNMYTFAIGSSAANQKVMQPGPNNNPAVDQCFVADSDDEMAKAFEAIEQLITNEVKVWTVTDPMSKWVNFDSFIDKDSDYMSYDNGVVTWDLTKDNAVVKGSADEGYTYHYSISYYVTLDESADGFQYDVFYPTNKETSLEYSFSYENETIQEDHTSLFRIPTVKALKGAKQVKLSKSVVNASPDYTANPDQKFYFNMYYVDDSGEINDNSILYIGKYDVYDNNDNPIKQEVDTGTPSDKSYQGIVLKDGQYAIIKGMTPKEKVAFEERNIAPGFTPKWSNNSITVSSNTNKTVQEAKCVNTYAISDLSVVKSNDPDYYVNDIVHYVDKGDVITYTIDVTNNGSATASGIWIKDAPPKYTSYVDGSIDANNNDVETTANGIGTDASLSWFIPELAPDQSVSLSFKVKVEGGYEDNYIIPNTAMYEELGETEGPPSSGDPSKTTNEVQNPTTVKSVLISKATEDKQLAEGDKVQYSISLKNTGNVKLENIALTDVIPEYTAYVDGSADPKAALKTGSDGKKYLEWSIQSLDPGETFTATFIAELVSGYPEGYVIKNIADAVIGDTDVPSNEVTNTTATVKGEVDDPPTPVNNDTDPPAQQTVLGENTSQTSDTTDVSPLLIIMLLAIASVATITIYKIRRKVG